METEAKTVAGRSIRFVLVAVLLLVALLGWAYWHYSVNALDRDPKTFSTKVQWVLWGMGMKQAYVSDTYGGDTPEETLNLYISALEAGDVSLAAKYYIPELWKGKEDKLALGKGNGVLPILINTYKKAESGTMRDNEYFIWVDDGEAKFHIRMVKNTYTDKWKIAEP